MKFRDIFILSALILALVSGEKSQAQNNPSRQQPSTAPANSDQGNLPPWRGSMESVQASIITGQGFGNKPPEGFARIYSLANGGFGTFAVAAPKGWIHWTAGTPAALIMDSFRKADPTWAKAHEPLVSGRDPRQRALLLNNSNDLIVVRISFVAQANAKILEEWRADHRRLFSKEYWDSTSNAEWVDHVSEKALKVTSYSPDKAYSEISYHISEAKNNTLWTLTCAGRIQAMQNNAQLCEKVASTFAPGPYVEN